MAPSSYDAYNQVSYVELNKRRRGEPPRDPNDRIENRIKKPTVKKIYLKRNGEWQSPTLKHLLEEVGPYVGLDNEATAIYDINGGLITHEDDIHELDTYYVTSDEALLIPPSGGDYSDDKGNRRAKNNSHAPRHTSMSAPEYSAQSRYSLYEGVSYPPTPPPRPIASNSEPFQRPLTFTPPYFSEKRSILKYPSKPHKNFIKRISKSFDHGIDVSSDIEEFEKFYTEAISSTNRPVKEQKERISRKAHSSKTPHHHSEDEFLVDNTKKEIIPSVQNDKHRSKNAMADKPGQGIPHASESRVTSDFDHENAVERDKQAMAKHKEKIASMTRSNSAVIYNRRDQTHPDAYIIYVFLNGQGLECQHINFQKKQLEKGMNYVLELIARRFNVNPLKLCNMDGKKIASTADLMSRGAYVLVAAGQRFRDSWYFLPDNAIDTSSNRENSEQNVQKDSKVKLKNRRKITKESSLSKTTERTQIKGRSKSEERSHHKHHDTVAPGMKFGI